MAVFSKLLLVVVAAAPALGLPLSAAAQGLADNAPRGITWFASGRGSLGLSVGGSHYGASCGGTALVCDNADTAVRVSFGGMANNYWGVELGYLDLGRMARAGGQSKAQGLNLSLLGRAPVWQSFSVFGKVGATYGRTETSTAGVAMAAGTERGLGLSYAAGLSYAFTPRLSATLEWESNDFRFAGTGRDQVRSTNLGLQYRY